MTGFHHTEPTVIWPVLMAVTSLFVAVFISVSVFVIHHGQF